MSVERDRALVRFALEAGFMLGEKEPQVSKQRIEQVVTDVLIGFARNNPDWDEDGIRSGIAQTVAGNVAHDLRQMLGAVRRLDRAMNDANTVLEVLQENLSGQEKMYSTLAAHDFKAEAKLERAALLPMGLGGPKSPLLVPKCPLCNEDMVRREAKRTGAPFWGCPSFPRCRGTRSMNEAEQDDYHDDPNYDLAAPDDGESEALAILNEEVWRAGGGILEMFNEVPDFEDAKAIFDVADNALLPISGRRNLL